MIPEPRFPMSSSPRALARTVVFTVFSIAIFGLMGMAPASAEGRTTAADLVGRWQGEIGSRDGGTEPIFLDLSQDSQGQLVGTFDLPERGRGHQPFASLEISLETLEGKAADDSAELLAFIEKGRTYLRGYWSSEGSSVDLSMHKLDADGNVIELEDRKRDAVVAAVDSPLSGRFKGTIRRPAETPIELYVDFGRDANGDFVGELDMEFQGVENLPLDRIELDADSIAFVATGLRDDPRFRGEIRAAGSVIEGTFEAGLVSFPFQLARIGEARLEKRDGGSMPSAVLETWLGRWQGTMRKPTGGQERIALELQRGAPGELVGKVDLPDRGVRRLPIIRLEAGAGSIFANLPHSETFLSGFLDEQKILLKGTWNSFGTTTLFELRRVDPPPSEAPEEPAG